MNSNRHRTAPSRLLPSPALVVALTALVAALAGSAVALPGKHSVDRNDLANNVVGTKQIQSGAVKGSDVKKAAVKGKHLGADVVNASHIATAAIGAEEMADPEPFQNVTAFGNGGDGDCIWSNSSVPAFGPVSFYKDPMGIVHLAGLAESVDGSGGDATCDDVGDGMVFTLPEGYRPDTTEVVSSGPGVIIAPDEGAVIGPDTLPPGVVYTSPGVNSAALDGITFRAAPQAPTTAPPAKLGSLAQVERALR